MRLRSAAILSTLAVTASLLVSAPRAGAAVVFADGFESGSLNAWSQKSGLQVVTSPVHGGAFAASSTGSVAWASRTLGSPTLGADATVWFRVENRQDAVTLMRLRTTTSTNVVRVFLNGAGRLAYRNERAGVTRASTLVVPQGSWHRLDVHVTIAGANGTVSVDLNGTAVPGLSRTESLGGDPIGRFEIGNRPTGKRFVLTLDDAVIDDRASAVVQPPSGVQVDASAGAVEVSWTPPAGTAPTAYRVYRDNVLVGTTVAPDTTLTDLEAGDVTRYVYTVVSTVGSQRSDPSSPVVATMPGFVAGDDAVIYAVGDIACKPTEQPTSTTCHHRATSDIAVAGAADAVLALGDLQYEKGQLNNFKNSYDPTWGRLKSITYPVPGNHEYYLDTTASGYDSYFLSTGSAPGETWDPAAPYYSFDLAGWHFVALNSNCTMPEAACGAGDDAQVQWLQQDLAANDGAACTIGYWHHSRWSSSSTAARRDDPTTEPFWAALDAADADVVLAAHQHFYERFEPVAAGGGASASGLRSFISGAGGRNFDVAGTPRPTSEAIIDGTFGVLKLTLHDGSYDWSFVPEFGAAETDSGSASCV